MLSQVQRYLPFDDSKTEWNHRELIFKEAGSYKISASVTDGYDTVNAEKLLQ